MAKKKGYGKECWHGKAKRATRKRDGVTWNPTEGAAVLDGQKSGYSGGATVGKPKTPRAGRGSHEASK